MEPDEALQKRNHTIYVTNDAIQKADELAQNWGVSRNVIFEQAIRAMFNARNALTYEVAKQQARAEIEQEREDQSKSV